MSHGSGRLRKPVGDLAWRTPRNLLSTVFLGLFTKRPMTQSTGRPPDDKARTARDHNPTAQAIHPPTGPHCAEAPGSRERRLPNQPIITDPPAV